MGACQTLCKSYVIFQTEHDAGKQQVNACLFGHCLTRSPYSSLGSLHM